MITYDEAKEITSIIKETGNLNYKGKNIACKLINYEHKYDNRSEVETDYYEWELIHNDSKYIIKKNTSDKLFSFKPVIT